MNKQLLFVTCCSPVGIRAIVVAILHLSTTVYWDYEGEERFRVSCVQSLKSQRTLLWAGHNLTVLGFGLDPVTGSELSGISLEKAVSVLYVWEGQWASYFVIK